MDPLLLTLQDDVAEGKKDLATSLLEIFGFHLSVLIVTLPDHQPIPGESSMDDFVSVVVDILYMVNQEQNEAVLNMVFDLVHTHPDPVVRAALTLVISLHGHRQWTKQLA